TAMRITIVLAMLLEAYYSLNCDGSWTTIGERCYKLQSSKSSWNAHYINCFFAGGKLASIESAQVNSEVKTLCHGSDAFIGGAAFGPFGPAWVWADGRPFAYTNWKDASYAVPVQEKPCIRIDSDGFWHPECCGVEASLYAVCLRSF
ncbi:hypothetical protein PFISCL1PPCAC_27738, partial [Pristionchus fissidentatus]